VPVVEGGGRKRTEEEETLKVAMGGKQMECGDGRGEPTGLCAGVKVGAGEVNTGDGGMSVEESRERRGGMGASAGERCGGDEVGVDGRQEAREVEIGDSSRGKDLATELATDGVGFGKENRHGLKAGVGMSQRRDEAAKPG
jgi:hypothetical protein